MAQAIQHTPSGFTLYLLDIFPLAEVREFTVKAILISAHLVSRWGFLKVRTPLELGYKKESILGVFLLVHFTAPPFAKIISRYHYTKNLPKMGRLAQIVCFWARIAASYFKFRLTFAEKMPSSAEKSYIPSYLFVVAITERMPTP